MLTRVMAGVRDVLTGGGRRSRRRTILVDGEPEDALRSSAAALRRLGARITRYDVEEGALEARWSSSERRARVTVGARDGRLTRLDIESDGDESGALMRRFRAELGG